MKHRTLDSDDDPYPRFGWKIMLQIWMKHHTLDSDDDLYSRF